MSEIQIEQPPSDAISNIRFSTTSSQYLLVSSWDASVRLYDIEANKLKHSYNHSLAVLDCYYKDMNQSYSGGLDKTLKYYDFTSQKETILGTHDQAIKCVHYSHSLNLIITGSWDKYIKLWDPRAPKFVGAYEQPDKVYTLDTCDNKLVVGTANRKIKIWDLKNMENSELRESNLKFQTRAIRCFPNKTGYVVSCIEGRVGIEYFDSDIQGKKYAFKCHRTKENGVEIIYPVNAIAFNSLYNTFATGGSDCMVNIWDPINKKRLCQFHSYPAGITSLSFDKFGNTLAIGSSYNYERGQLLQKDTPKDNIFIRRVSELETKPKSN